MKFCPHCGTDLERLTPVALGTFRFDPNGEFTVGGRIVRLTPSERITVQTLIEAYPRHVSRYVLLERMDSRGDGNTLSVLLHRLRRKLRAAGAGDAIDSLPGQGCRWNLESPPLSSPARGGAETEAMRQASASAGGNMAGAPTPASCDGSIHAGSIASRRTPFPQALDAAA